MSILIKGMEMPKNCGDCPCGSVFFGYKCMAEQKKFEKYPLDSRQDWCPLVPVPPHGDLIDRDALQISIEVPLDGKSFRYVHVNNINNAPTIIQAEE